MPIYAPRRNKTGVSMIKALLGATALIAVTLSAVGSAVAEEEPELGLGGYYKTFSWAGANEPGSGPGAALHDSDQGARFDLPPTCRRIKSYSSI